MPAAFESGFVVREPAWHGLATVLPEHPDPDEARKLAGLDWDPISEPVFAQSVKVTDGGPIEVYERIEDWQRIVRSDNSATLHIAKGRYDAIGNGVPFELAEALHDAGNGKLLYESAGSAHGGKQVFITAMLDEPVQVPGDNSLVLPLLSISTSHDGSLPLSASANSIRQVCANTVQMAIQEGENQGTRFVFRHTPSWRARVEEAKHVISGLRAEAQKYEAWARDLLGIEVNDDVARQFIDRFIPMPPNEQVSDRVKHNVEKDRDKLRAFMASETNAPVMHSAYGLVMAGIEFLDHGRGYRTPDTYVTRTLLRAEPAKRQVEKLVRQLAAA